MCSHSRAASQRTAAPCQGVWQTAQWYHSCERPTSRCHWCALCSVRHFPPLCPLTVRHAYNHSAQQQHSRVEHGLPAYALIWNHHPLEGFVDDMHACCAQGYWIFREAWVRTRGTARVDLMRPRCSKASVCYAQCLRWLWVGPASGTSCWHACRFPQLLPGSSLLHAGPAKRGRARWDPCPAPAQVNP